MFNKIIVSCSLLFLLMFTSASNACDDKACESAYLAETQQHVANHIRRAEATKAERHAYSKNRHRRAYALHIHFMLFGIQPS